MAVSLRRKIYSRGGSHETTIPLQLLLGLNLEESNEIIFEYDPKMARWYVRFEKSDKSINDNSKNIHNKKIVFNNNSIVSDDVSNNKYIRRSKNKRFRK